MTSGKRYAVNAALWSGGGVLQAAADNVWLSVLFFILAASCLVSAERAASWSNEE